MAYVTGFLVFFGITIGFLTLIGLSVLAIAYLVGKVGARFGELAGIVTLVIGIAAVVAAVFTGSTILDEVVPIEGLFK